MVRKYAIGVGLSSVVESNQRPTDYESMHANERIALILALLSACRSVKFSRIFGQNC